MTTNLWTRKQPIAVKADEAERKKKREEGETALIFALLIGAFAAFGIIMFANSEPDEQPSQVADCTSIASQADRLACFDTLARSQQTPFKGAPPAAQLDSQK